VASLHFTQNLARHTECPTAAIAAGTVAELLERYFESWPGVRDYVLDNQGEVRQHVKVLPQSARPPQAHGSLATK
jgi:sulfur-carrier protein